LNCGGKHAKRSPGDHQGTTGELRRRGGELIVSGLNEEMTDTLSLQQVRSVFWILRTEAEALAARRTAGRQD